ncbi:hypothetical protein PENTCL1PPCAC_535, partial [Pristionchus entomophagus]
LCPSLPPILQPRQTRRMREPIWIDLFSIINPTTLTSMTILFCLVSNTTLSPSSIPSTNRPRRRCERLCATTRTMPPGSDWLLVQSQRR